MGDRSEDKGKTVNALPPQQLRSPPVAPRQAKHDQLRYRSRLALEDYKVCDMSKLDESQAGPMAHVVLSLKDHSPMVLSLDSIGSEISENFTSGFMPAVWGRFKG